MMAYPNYFDLSTKPVRQHPIPTYWEDPEEAGDYYCDLAFWELDQERREARRRIVTAITRRARVKALPKSDDWYKQAIKLGVRMAESEARRMLALKAARLKRTIKSPPLAP
jgi:hypothetical protein